MQSTENENKAVLKKYFSAMTDILVSGAGVGKGEGDKK